MDIQPSIRTHLKLFLDFCSNKQLECNQKSLEEYFQHKPRKQIKLIIKHKPKTKTKQNDYLIFITNCRNNGFCVQLFNDKPAVFTDYIHCPDTKLVIQISNIDCLVINYKIYKIVVPKSNITFKFNPDINPLIQEQLNDFSKIDFKPNFIQLEVVHWIFKQKHYLVELDTQKVYFNNSFIGIRKNQNQTYYIE